MSLQDLEAKAKAKKEVVQFVVIFYLCLAVLALLYSATK